MFIATLSDYSLLSLSGFLAGKQLERGIEWQGGVEIFPVDQAGS